MSLIPASTLLDYHIIIGYIYIYIYIIMFYWLVVGYPYYTY